MSAPHILRTGVAVIALACAAALIGSGIVTAPAPATKPPDAGPRARALVAAAPRASRILKQTRYADVDGDGRLDLVGIYRVGAAHNQSTGLLERRWQVKVTTATGNVAWSPLIRSPLPGHRWWGSANLDGSRGKELLFVTGTEDFLRFLVLHWDAGALRFEKAPAGPRGPKRLDKTWDAATETFRSGYRLFTYRGERYVNMWQATCPDHPGSCTVRVMRSVWRHGSWQPVSAPQPTKVPRAEILARRPLGALVIHR